MVDKPMLFVDWLARVGVVFVVCSIVGIALWTLLSLVAPAAGPACWDAPYAALDADGLEWKPGTTPPLVCGVWYALETEKTPRRSIVRCWAAKPMSQAACDQVPAWRKLL